MDATRTWRTARTRGTRRGCAAGPRPGPAAAVSAGEADVGLGTDTSGSLRVPAAFCGLYALRPTLGLVSTAGVVPLAPSLDVCGTLARDPETLALAMTALAGWDRVPAMGDPPARVGLFDGGGAEALVAAHLEALGSEVVAVALPDFAQAREVHRVIQAVEAADVHDRELADAARYLSDEVRERLAAGRAVTAAQLAAARTAAAAYRSAVLGALDDVDVIVAPVTAFGAPLREATEVGGLALREALMRHVGPFSLLGAPVLAVPAALRDGLPLGVQVLGRPGTDRELIALALRL